MKLVLFGAIKNGVTTSPMEETSQKANKPRHVFQYM